MVANEPPQILVLDAGELPEYLEFECERFNHVVCLLLNFQMDPCILTIQINFFNWDRTVDPSQIVDLVDFSLNQNSVLGVLQLVCQRKSELEVVLILLFTIHLLIHHLGP